MSTDTDLSEPLDESEAPAVPARPWWRQRWVAATAAGLVVLLATAGGSFAAGASSVDPTESQAYAAMADDLADVMTERDDALGEIAGAQQTARDALGDVAERELAADDRDLELDERKARLDTDEAARMVAFAAAQAEADAAMAAREAAVGIAEATAAANTVSGNGTFLVGTDIQPGTYRSDGGSLCYWARLSGLSGGLGDIISNSISPGQQFVEVRASDAAFQSNGCGAWVRQ